MTTISNNSSENKNNSSDAIAPSMAAASTAPSVPTQVGQLETSTPITTLGTPGRSLASRYSPDDQLQSYFARPIAIGTYSWTTASVWNSYQVWKLYRDNAIIQKKLATYMLYRGTLHVVVMLATQPQLYGGLQISYWPYGTLRPNSLYSAYTKVFPYPPQTFFMNPANSGSVHFVCPYFMPSPWALTQSRGYNAGGGFDGADVMGTLTILPCAVLARADAVAPGTVDVQIYAWMTDVEVSAPSYTFQAEYRQSPISAPATALSNIAGKLTNVPYIGPFARAIEIGSGAVGAIAKIFGFSRPVDIRDYSIMVTKPYGRTANVVGLDPVEKLSTDPKQELSIDPGTVGLSCMEMSSILAMAQQESYLTSFTLATTDAPGANVATWRVDPTCGNNDGNGNPVINHLSWAAAPFNMWTGSLIYRFRVFASPFQRGRIFIFHDPAAGSVETPTNLNAANPDTLLSYLRYCILDISSDTDYEFRVGWNQQYEWALSNSDPTGSGGFAAGAFSTSSGFNTQNIFNCNGQLGVFVDAPLTSPGAASVTVNVTVRAGDDFQVADPAISRLNWYSYQSLDSMRVISATVAPATLCDLVPTVMDAESLALRYTGERIVSARAMAKRYSCLGTINFPTATAPAARNWRVDEWFVTSAPLPMANGSFGGQATNQNNCNTTWPTWWAMTHAGFRGGLRYKIMHNVPATYRAYFVVTRRPQTLPSYWNGSILVGLNPAEGTPNGDVRAYSLFARRFGDGAMVFDCTSSSAIEFEIPWHWNGLFSIVRQGTTGTQALDNCARPGFFIYLVTNGYTPTGLAITLFQAAAEDFTPYYYVTPPFVALTGGGAGYSSGAISG